MTVKLKCSGCATHFGLPPGSAAAQVLDQFSVDGPASVLGDGETIEDSLSVALSEQEPVHCPQCGAAVSLDQESLAEFARELLGEW